MAVRWRLAVAAASLGLLAASVAAGPASSAPVGPLGPPVDLGTTKAIDAAPEPQLAVLADGTTLAAWVAATGSIHVRVRPAGSSSWGASKVFPIDPGWVVGVPLYVVFTTLWVVPAGPSGFLMVWQEDSGGLKRIRAQRLTRAGAAAEAPATLIGPAPVFLADVATNAGGRAAVSILRNSDPVPAVFVVRPTPTAAWGAPITVNTTLPVASLPTPSVLISGVAVHDSGTVCAMYPGSVSTTATTNAVTLRSRCGAPAALASAPEQVVGTFQVNTHTEDFGSSASLESTSAGFMVAGIVASAGTTALPIAGGVPATAVRVRTRPAASGSWSTAATFGAPGEFNARPRALSSPSGVAAHYLRIRGGVGSGPATPITAYDQQVAQRRGSQPWTPVATVASLSTTGAATGKVFRSTASALGPGGEMLVSAPQPRLPSGWGSGFVRRSGWGGGFTATTGIFTSIEISAAIAASGRATVIGRDFAIDVRIAQSPLPKPFVRSAATITAVPRVGAASTCAFALTDAASVTRQWRVNGVVRGTAATYTPTSSDRGKTLTCRVTGTNPTGSTVTTSPGRVVT